MPTRTLIALVRCGERIFALFSQLPNNLVALRTSWSLILDPGYTTGRHFHKLGRERPGRAAEKLPLAADARGDRGLQPSGLILA
jgi:hypothetical protein